MQSAFSPLVATKPWTPNTRLVCGSWAITKISSSECVCQKCLLTCEWSRPATDWSQTIIGLCDISRQRLLVYLREQRHVGAARCSRVGQDEQKTGQLGTSWRGQASLGVKHLLAGVHSVWSRPQQSLKHTRRWGRRWAVAKGRGHPVNLTRLEPLVGHPSYKLKRMWLRLAASGWEGDERKTNEASRRIHLSPSPEVISNSRSSAPDCHSSFWVLNSQPRLLAACHVAIRGAINHFTASHMVTIYSKWQVHTACEVFRGGLESKNSATKNST